MARIRGQVAPPGQFKDGFAAKDKDGKDRMVDFEEFSKFYQDMRFREEIASLFRTMVPSEWANLSLEDMRRFCVDKQRMTFGSDAEVRRPGAAAGLRRRASWRRGA